MPRSLLFASLTLASLWFFSSGQALAQGDAWRLWKDASGKFQIRATLIDQSDKVVRLRTEDAREIAVPIDRLGQADQEYLKSLDAPQDNPFAGGKPAGEDAAADADAPPIGSAPQGLRALQESSSAGLEMALPGTGTTRDLSSSAAAQRFKPDPRPGSPSIPAALVQVTSVDPYDKVAVPVLANVAEGIVLVSIGRNKSGSPEETRGRIYSVHLQRNDSKLLWDEPHTVQVLDHDASSNRTLIVEKLDQFQRGGELVMLEELESGKPQTLYRRILPGAGKAGFAPQVQWARMLSGSHVAAVVDTVLYVWDLPAAQLIYRVENASATPPPALSANLRYLAFPRSGGAVVLETASGDVCTTIDMGGSAKPGVAFHPNGRLIALCAGNQYLVWDCVANQVVAEATTTADLGTHPIDWIAAKMFRSQLGDAVHTDLGMSVWKYNVAPSTDPLVVGDKLLVATKNQSCAVMSVSLPHAAAEAAIEKLMRAGDAAMLVRAGSSVAIAIEATVEGVDPAEIKTALSGAAEKAGWKVSDRAPITLVATIGRGKQETLSYRSMRGENRNVSTATLTPFTAELEIRGGQDVLWTRSTTNHVPRMLHLEEGETVQDAVKRYEKPDSAFFARLNLPPHIPKPEISKQIGMSILKDGQWQDINLNLPPNPNLRTRRR